MIALPVPGTDTRVLTGRGPLVAAAAGQLGASASSAACISNCASQATSSRIFGSGRPSENSSLDVAADTAVGNTGLGTGAGASFATWRS